MRTVPRILLALLLVAPPMLAWPGYARAHDDDEEYYEDDEGQPPEEDVEQEPVPEDYEGALSSYGQWDDDDEYGRVWRPTVTVGWSPYVDGYWAWTPYGWTWVSYEPWAWTFHYGRWAVSPAGWVWVPGFVWGPAWVDWYWGDGYVGWAPLSPFGTHVTVVNRFVFVRERDFCGRGLPRTIVRGDRVPRHVLTRWERRGPEHGRAPAFREIERVSGHRITRLDHKPPGTVAPREFTRGGRRHGELARPGRERGGQGEHRIGRPDARTDQGRLGRSRTLEHRRDAEPRVGRRGADDPGAAPRQRGFERPQTRERGNGEG
ncbi:MAG TPA: DUF6600 domain-containing protein, partial [Candidatus Binatia bacterium]|nr:DUF6600 domain-containing protein [Candidatus Binatia bacterium]